MIIDMHSDVVADVVARREAGEVAVLARRHLPSWRAGDVGAAICVVGGDFELVPSLRRRSAYENAIAYLDALAADVAEADGAIELALTPAELESTLEAGRFAIVPGLEGASPVGGSLEHLRDLHERGVRSVGLTWNSRNEVAAGVGFEGGLTEFGAEAVKLMQELGIVVDLAHASPQTFWDVIELSEGPVLVSHANAKAICDHPRNLDDEQLYALRARGGVIGIVLYPDYVGAEGPTLEDVGAHAMHLIDRVGVEGVGIGADFMGYFAPELLDDVFPEEEGWSVPSYPGEVDDSSGLPRVLGELERRGLDEAAAGGIASGNFRRFWHQV